MLWVKGWPNNEMNVFPVGLGVGLSQLLLGFIRNRSLVKVYASMGLKRKCVQRVENVEEVKGFSILDLPELALEGILSRLSPASLCNMAGVCTDLRERCRSNYLWDPRLKAKWGKVIGPAAYREWQRTVAMHKETAMLDGCKANGWLRSLSCIWQFSWLRLQPEINREGKSGPPCDSVMAWYLALESGKFWFPAQVYNREHGHVGFMLSCYDAELSYDCRTDTFQARYPPHGHRTVVVEEGIQWERLRAPPVDTPARDLHPSDCLNDLCPGDNVEIQWRRNTEFPYGWWYGVVGHSDYCDKDSRHCQCHLDDTLILEFNQYTPGSRWRRASINRKDHHEEGNEAEGFYGGIRKLQTEEEISTWKQLWPSETLE